MKQETINTFIESFKNLGSVKDAAIAANISIATGRRWVKKYNLNFYFKTKIDKERIELFIKEFKKIGSIELAAKKYKINYGSARRIIAQEELGSFKKCRYCGSSNIVKTEKGLYLESCADHLKQYYNDKKDKSKETFKEIYGIENPFQLEEIKKKRKQTCIENYGTENPHQNAEVQEKTKNTNIKKYGVSSPASNFIIKKKTKETNIKRYGVEYVTQCDSIKTKIEITRKSNYWNFFLKRLELKQLIPLFDKDYYINNKTNFRYKCKKCGKEFLSNFYSVDDLYCSCLKWRSQYEDEIFNWLARLKIKNIKKNKKFFTEGRQDFEVDVFIPDFNLGIEFHGIYWHSDLYKEKNYHQKKYLYFKEKGIELIQIFENEWINKQEIVKSIIKNKLKLNDSIYARKCELKEISFKEAKEFLEFNHLQGNTVSKINIGLFYENELVCLGTFGKNRFKKEDSWELIRFCNEINFNIVGGFNKILKYFENTYKPKKLTSFIDVRYFSGSGYLKNGFKFSSLTKPDYFYFKNKSFKLEHRINFQKHKLKNKLDNFNPNITEYENMINNNYLRIYDAGNIKMELII